MDLPDTDRNRLRLWRRWEITFDWLGFSPQLKRVYFTLLVHQQPWSTRALAEYTQLPQTSIRRQLETMTQMRIIERTRDGVQFSKHALGFAANLHQELVKYVHGGHRLSEQVMEEIRQTPGVKTASLDKLANHVWLPVINASAAEGG